MFQTTCPTAAGLKNFGDAILLYDEYSDFRAFGRKSLASKVI
jgi:hypothetical protein